MMRSEQNRLLVRARLGFDLAYSQNALTHESVNRVGVEAGMPCLRDTKCIGCHRKWKHVKSAQRSREAVLMFLHCRYHVGRRRGYQCAKESRHDQCDISLQSEFGERLINWSRLQSAARRSDMFITDIVFRCHRCS